MKKNIFLVTILFLFVGCEIPFIGSEEDEGDDTLSSNSSNKNSFANDIDFGDISIHTPKLGDSYSIKLTMEYTSGEYDGLRVQGDLTLVIDREKQNPSGVTCFRTTMSGTLNGLGDAAVNSMPFLTKSFHYQDDKGSYDCGKYAEDEVTEVFVSDTSDSNNGLILWVEYPIIKGNVQSAITYYSDDSWNDCTALVTGGETVTVSAGSFKAFKLEESCTNSEGDTITSVSWYSPEISLEAPLQGEANFMNDEFGSVTMSIELLDYIHVQ
jgi:hypothetical protein